VGAGLAGRRRPMDDAGNWIHGHAGRGGRQREGEDVARVVIAGLGSIGVEDKGGRGGDGRRRDDGRRVGCPQRDADGRDVRLESSVARPVREAVSLVGAFARQGGCSGGSC
jgi:hypothetical protein